MAEYDRDFLNNEINIGDKVIFEAPNYRHLTIGTVVTKAEKSCQIEYINIWNYSGKKQIVRQFYEQILKYPDNIQVTDVVSVVHGHWIEEDEVICSECGELGFTEFRNGEFCHPNYCPWCGAKMDGGVDNG